MPFSFRMKIHENEVEVSGSQKEVLSVLKDLPSLIEKITKALAPISYEKTNDVSGRPVVVRSSLPEKLQKRFPSIKGAKNCSKAVLKLLETEWGAWRPRTMSEIVSALKTNSINYPSSTLSGVLSWLVKKGKVRRWKTDAGYVYILAEKEE